MNNGVLESPKSYYSYPFGLLGQGGTVPMPDDYWHPEAMDWRSRVIANGGSVSYSMMVAVSKFCRTIDSSGLRSKFYRVNLFCGNNLNSCVVPLYRGQSLYSHQYGNRTDTNINFVSTDYNSTGVNRGLKSNRNKHLRTGLSPSTVGRDIHISYYAPYQNPVHAYGFTIGASTSANTRQTTLVQWVNAGEWQFINGANNGVNILRNIVPPPFFLLGSTLSNGSSIFVADNTVSTGTLGGHTPTEQDFYIFDENRAGSGTGGFGTDARLAFYSIGRSLSFEESQILRLAILTLNNDLGITIPIVSNPDAQSWINRVYFNGGTVSLSTASAVNQFCNSIDSAGIRDRFLRLNLFCGDNLAACLVPLYRASSLSVTQLGDATDTNINFVSTDYRETGSTGGLVGDGGTKRLTMGAITFASITAANSHMSVYGSNLTAGGGDRAVMGTRPASANNQTMQIWTSEAGATINRGLFGNGTLPVNGSPVFSQGHLLCSAISSTDLRFYVSGVQTGIQTSDRGSNVLANTTAMYVFSSWSNGLVFPNGPNPGRMASYSYGLGMTDSQVSSYYSALQTFHTLLGRNV